MNRPGIVGHRGAGNLAPENTLAAVYTAIRMGLTAIECDVQATADGELVLFHDTSIERTTDGSGLLADTALDDLKLLDAGVWFDYLYRGEHVATFQDALELIDGRLTVFVELKQPSTVDRTADIVERCRGESWCRIISYSEYVLAQSARRLPQVPRTFLINPESAPDPLEVIEHLTAIPADMVGVPLRWLETDLVAKIRQAGFQVITGPVDTVGHCQQTTEAQPDFLLTNEPGNVISYFDDQDSA
jgi:glycerophosphoryl diester phosphodiesterase